MTCEIDREIGALALGQRQRRDRALFSEHTACSPKQPLKPEYQFDRGGNVFVLRGLCQRHGHSRAAEPSRDFSMRGMHMSRVDGERDVSDWRRADARRRGGKAVVLIWTSCQQIVSLSSPLTASRRSGAGGNQCGWWGIVRMSST